jgi:hypothetical protein
MAALGVGVRTFGGTSGATVLVVVRVPDNGSYLCMVRNGVEVACVRITVLDPEIMNDVEAAEGIRNGLRAWDDGDMPLIVAEESAYRVALGNREEMAALIVRSAPSLSPGTFPWMVDTGAHLGRRRVALREREPSRNRGVVLHQLHLALEDYWRAPDGRHALTRVRRNLNAVRNATEGHGTPAHWREMHNFADVLLNAPKWRRLG